MTYTESILVARLTSICALGGYLIGQAQILRRQNPAPVEQVPF